VADLIARKPQVVEACEAILHDMLGSSETDEKRKRLEQDMFRVRRLCRTRFL